MIEQKTSAEVYDLIKDAGKKNLIDVRTPEEYGEVHAVDAVNVPLDQFVGGVNVEELLQGIAKDETVYIICRSGARSMKAAEICEAAGYSQLVNVSGGTMEWVDSGLPVVK